MEYMLRWIGQGRIHEAFFRQPDTAEHVFNLILDQDGIEVELWQGSRVIKKGVPSAKPAEG